VSNFYDNNQRQNDNKAWNTSNFLKLTEIWPTFYAPISTHVCIMSYDSAVMKSHHHALEAYEVPQSSVFIFLFDLYVLRTIRRKNGSLAIFVRIFKMYRLVWGYVLNLLFPVPGLFISIIQIWIYIPLGHVIPKSKLLRYFQLSNLKLTYFFLNI
jgi:hypothetical protein